MVLDPDGNYKNLKTIINTAILHPEIKLSNDAKKDIGVFRKFGNLSAHGVKYNRRKDDVSNKILQYRTVIEELLYTDDLIISKSDQGS